MSIEHVVNCQRTRDLFIQSVVDDFEKHGYTKYSYSHGRTITQNAAMHRWFGQIADSWNAAGKGQKAVIDQLRLSDIANTKESVKDIYKTILKALTGKGSTAQQSTVEPSVVAEELHKFSSERLNVVLPDFPRRK